MNFYMTIGNRFQEPIARTLYLEIAEVEEEHVTHYKSMLDPTLSWCEMLVLHEYNECYLYHSFMQHEDDARIKRIWELHLGMELEHLRLAGEMMKTYDRRDPQMILPKTLPEPVRFESNKAYVRSVLENRSI